MQTKTTTSVKLLNRVLCYNMPLLEICENLVFFVTRTKQAQSVHTGHFILLYSPVTMAKPNHRASLYFAHPHRAPSR